MLIKQFIKQFKAELDKKLSSKTGWGRNEIMMAVDSALLDVASDMLDNHPLPFSDFQKE